MTTLLCDDRTTEVRGARADGDELWLPLAELRAASGWELKPEGACRDETCVPIPSTRRAEFVRPEAFNLAALWRHLGRPVLHDDSGDLWLFGDAPANGTAALETAQAPDFTLADLDGREHSLSDYRGKKVFLLTWSSW